VRVGVFVDVCVGAEGARAVKPLERLGPTRYARMHRCPCVSAPRTADTGTALRGARGARGGLVHCTV
jgi:hypothetical protein